MFLRVTRHRYARSISCARWIWPSETARRDADNRTNRREPAIIVPDMRGGKYVTVTSVSLASMNVFNGPTGAGGICHLRRHRRIDSMVAQGGAAMSGVAMSDLMLLSEAQMRRITPYFPLSHGIPRVDDRRIYLCPSQRIALARRAQGIRSPQDDLQSLHPLEQTWCVQSNFGRTHDQPREAGTIDDRCYPFESTSHGSQPAKKGDAPRRIGRPKAV